MAQFKDELVIMHDSAQFPADYAKDHTILDFAGFSKNAKITKVTNPGLGVYIIEGVKPYKTIFGEMEARETQDINGNKKYFVDVTEVPEGTKIEVLAARFDAGRDVWYGHNPVSLAAGDYFKIAVIAESMGAIVIPPASNDPKDIINADGSIIHADGSYSFPDGYKVQNAFQFYPDGTYLDVRTPGINGEVKNYMDGSKIISPSTDRMFPNTSFIREDGTWYIIWNKITATRNINGEIYYSDGCYRTLDGKLFNKDGTDKADDGNHISSFRAWANLNYPYPHIYKDGSHYNGNNKTERIYYDQKIQWGLYQDGSWFFVDIATGVNSTFSFSHNTLVYTLPTLPRTQLTRTLAGDLVDDLLRHLNDSAYPNYYFPLTLQAALQHYGYPFDPQW